MTTTEILSLIVLYALLCGGVALFAEWRGRDRWAWFGFSIILSPLLAFLALVLLGPQRDDPVAESARVDERATTILTWGILGIVAIAIVGVVVIAAWPR